MPEITQEELDLFNKYKELGDIAEVETNLSEVPKMRFDSVITKASELTGFNKKVLSKISQGLDLRVEDENVFVGDKPIEDYADEEWGDFLPALKGTNTKQTVNFVEQSNTGKKKVTTTRHIGVNLVKNLYGTKKDSVN